MKRLLFVALLCAIFATTTHAQIPPVSFTVDNQTSCNVYCDLWGKQFALASCTLMLQNSGILTFPPNSITTYSDPSTVPIGTLGTSDQFVKADIYDAPNGCTQTLIGTVGEPCGSYSTTTGSYSVYDVGCATCASITATWDQVNSKLIFQ